MMKKVKTKVTTRHDFAKLINELNLKVGVELGVSYGAYSDFLLSNSDLEKLYSIDSWSTDYSETLAATFKHWTINHGEVEKAEAISREVLSKHGQRSIIMKGNSFDYASQFEDNSVDFVFFDAGHRFTGFALDMINWWPKIKKGGLIAGHDYWRKHRYEVMDVANAFLFEHRLIMHLTYEDKNRTGGGYAPPSFWAIKEDLTKKEFFAAMPDALRELQDAKAKLLENKVRVILPYQYSDVDFEDDIK
jgi:predicted O-methyltransferase YrrM